MARWPDRVAGPILEREEKMEKDLLGLNELLLSENPAASTDTHSVLLA